MKSEFGIPRCLAPILNLTFLSIGGGSVGFGWWVSWRETPVVVSLSRFGKCIEFGVSRNAHTHNQGIKRGPTVVNVVIYVANQTGVNIGLQFL